MDIREKLVLQKAVRVNLDRIKSADLSIKEKFAIQKETREALLKLGKGVKSDNIGADTPIFDALAKGDFDNLDLSAYIEKLRAAFDEIQEVAKLIPHAERYADKAPDSVGKMQEALSDLETTMGAVQKMEEAVDSKKEEEKESKAEEKKEGKKGEDKEEEEKKVNKEKESKAEEKKEGKEGEDKEKKEKLMTENFDAEEPDLEPMAESVQNENDIIETKPGETFKPYIPEVAFEQ